MTVANVTTFTAKQLREAYAFQARQGYTGDMGRTAAAMKLAGEDADDELVEHIAQLIASAIESSGS